jgi:FAD:protein FMN transferase
VTALLILPLACLTISCKTQPAESAELSRYEFQRPEMGVPFRIVLYASDEKSAEAAAEAAFERVKQLNAIMSDYDPDSELSKLSAGSGQGQAVPVSPDLWLVLSRAEELAKRSDGAFDITVGPFVNLWRRARRVHQLPDPQRLAQARKAVGYKHVRLDPQHRTVELLVPNMRLDLGGIAKGYAVDEALKTLRQHGIDRALVEGGGDVAVSEPPPGKTGWRFELSPLDVTNAPSVRYLSLKNAAISTSGDLYQRLEIDGKRYSHIVDPHTGIGLTDHSLVSVIAPDSITADSLTKVVSVLGPEKGLKFIEATSRVAVRVMREPGERIEAYESSRFKRYYQKKD